MVIRIREGARVSDEQIEFARNFLKTTFVKRMAAAQSLAAGKENIVEFVSSLEYVFREKMLESASEDFIAALDEISRDSMLVSARYGSPKMILEHLALVLPRL